MKILFRLCLVMFFCSCSMTSVNVPKINGVSFVASRDSISEKHVQPVLNINANYAAIMPFGFIRSKDNPEIIYNTNRQWFGETNNGAKQYIEELHKHHVKVMMKPHIWIRGEFTGHMKMDTEELWKQLEESYSKFILDFAELAKETKVDILCIGTELEQFVVNRPEYWKVLIKKIKTVYKDKLTYAANWDEYKRTPFWSELDYVGVDAYFPVSDAQTPTIEECRQGWQKHKNEIKSISKKINKPILFTEFGYRSVDYTAKEPWKSDRYEVEANLDAQNNATQALFDEFWSEDWFAGGFIWKWFINHDRAGGKDDNQFTPQNKPVEVIVKERYSDY
ncbi:MAG: glycoside hydrolase [Flavobacteriaceae bacterium]